MTDRRLVILCVAALLLAALSPLGAWILVAALAPVGAFPGLGVAPAPLHLRSRRPLPLPLLSDAAPRGPPAG